MASSSEDSKTESLRLEEQQPQLAHPRDQLSKFKFAALVVMNILTSYVSGYDVSNLANIQAPVYKAFGHIDLLPWVAVSYSLANASTIPIARKAATFFDLRPFLFISLTLFVVGAAICGAAPDIKVLIVGRVLNGIGAAAVYQINQYYNVTFCRAAELARMQSLIGLSWALGIISGPSIGGAFADNAKATWRWAFYINLPICAIVYPLLFVAPSLRLHPQKDHSQPAKSPLASIDWLGTLLHVATLCLFATTLNFSGPTWSLSSSIAVGCVTAVVLAAYVAQQYFSFGTTPENRIMPVHLLRHRTAALTAVGTAVSSVNYAVTLYYSPLLLAFTRGHSPLSAAVRLLPFICVFIVSVVVSGGLLPVVRYYMPHYLLAGALCALGGGLMTTVRTDTSESTVMGFGVILGAAAGLTWQTALGVTGVVLPKPKDRFDAAALQSMAQLVPVVVSLSIAGCVYQNLGFAVLKESIGKMQGGARYGDEQIHEALAGVASSLWATQAGDSDLDAEARRLAVEGVTEVITKLFWILVGAGILGFGAAACMKWEALNFGKKGAEKMEEGAVEVTQVDATVGQKADRDLQPEAS